MRSSESIPWDGALRRGAGQGDSLGRVESERRGVSRWRDGEFGRESLS